MTAAEYADTAADQLYADGPPTAADVKRALADAWRAGWKEGERQWWRHGWRVGFKQAGQITADLVATHITESVVSKVPPFPTLDE